MYFSIVHISLNFALRNVKFRVTVEDIHLEGTVPQNFDYVLVFVLYKKTGNFSIIFCIFFFKIL